MHTLFYCLVKFPLHFSSLFRAGFISSQAIHFACSHLFFRQIPFLIRCVAVSVPSAYSPMPLADFVLNCDVITYKERRPVSCIWSHLSASVCIALPSCLCMCRYEIELKHHKACFSHCLVMMLYFLNSVSLTVLHVIPRR